MRLSTVVETLGLEVLNAGDGLDRDVESGYAGDLLSDVMANGAAGSLWITIQTHPNIIAIAALKELAGVIVANGRKPDRDTLVRAGQEKIPLFGSSLPAFELAGRMYQMGIRGRTGC